MCDAGLHPAQLTPLGPSQGAGAVFALASRQKRRKSIAPITPHDYLGLVVLALTCLQAIAGSLRLFLGRDGEPHSWLARPHNILGKIIHLLAIVNVIFGCAAPMHGPPPPRCR